MTRVAYIEIINEAEPTHVATTTGEPGVTPAPTSTVDQPVLDSLTVSPDSADKSFCPQ